MFKLELLKAVFVYFQIHDTMNIMRLFEYAIAQNFEKKSERKK